MTRQPTFLQLALASALAFFFLASSPLWAATFYWDNDGTTTGFGTAGGTWAAPTANLWSTDSTGTAAPEASITTTSADTVYFGTDTVALATGDITVSGTVAAGSLLFGKTTGNITFNGGTIDLSGGLFPTIGASSAAGSTTALVTFNSDIQKASGTINIGRQNTTGENYIFNGVISGGAGLDLRPVNNGAYVALNGLNTFSGNVSLITGQLNVNTVADSGVASSLGQGTTVSMGGGGGQAPLIWYTGTAAGSTNRTFRSTSTGDSRIVAQDGALTLAGALTTTGTGSYWFKFSGAANSGINTVSGTIHDGTGKINVSVISTTPLGGSAEAGVWRFSGANTYTGVTTITTGTLIFANKASQSSGSAATVSAAGSIGLGVGAVSGDFSDSDVAGLFNSGTLSGFASFSMNAASGVALDTTAGSFTQSTVLTGSRALTKFGDNILTLAGINTYTGVTTISGGTLQLGDGTSGKDGTIASASIVNNGNLTYNRFGSVTSTAVISGTGSVTKLGAGIQTLSGTNSYSGATTVTAGILTFANTGARSASTTVTAGPAGTVGLGVGAVSGDYSDADVAALFNTNTLAGFSLDAASGVALDTTAGNFTQTTALTAARALTKLGANTLTLTGANTYTGATTIAGGTLQIGDGGTTGSLSISSAISGSSGATLAFNRSDAAVQGTDFAAGIGGDLGITKSGAGTLTLNAANTYTGETTISGGKIRISNNDALGTTAGRTVIQNGASLELTGGITIAEAITNQGGGGGKLNSVSGTNTLTGLITLEGGMDLRGNNYIFKGGFTSANNSGINFNGANYIVQDTAITIGSGAFGVTSAANFAANATEINVGGNVWGTTRINFGGYLKIGGTDFLPTSTDVEFGWSTQGNSWGTLDLNGFNQSVASIGIASISVGLGGDQKITGGGTLTVNLASGSKTYEGRITDGTAPTALTKNGTGTQILKNLSGTASSYTGTTTISAGILEIQSGVDIGDASVVTLANIAGASLDVTGTANSELIGGLAGGGTTGGTVNIGAGNFLQVSNAAAATDSFSGAITGAGGFTKLGDATGIQILSGANSYAGGTSIAGGTLQLVKLVSMPATGAVAVGTGATLAVNVGGAGEWTTGTSGNGTIGGLIAGIGGQSGGTVTYTGAVTLGLDTSNAAGTQTYSGAIADVGTTLGLTKLGTGTLALAGASTYTGTTFIANGTLQADVADVAATSGALGNGGNITFTGGTLQYTANSAGTDYSTRIVNSTSAMTFDTNGQTVTFGTALATTNTGGLTKDGSGLLDIKMGTSYTGTTTISGGTLRFTNVSDLAGVSTAAFLINNGSTLEFQSSVGGANRTVLNNKTLTFDSSGGGTINFNNGNHLFQGGANTHNFITTGGSKNTISSTNGGFMNMQNSGNITFTVADGADAVDLELSATFNNGLITKNGAGTMSITGAHNGSFPITINAGTLEVGGSGRLAGGTFTAAITNDGVFKHSSSQDQTLSGNITGSGSLWKSSGAALTLSGNNSYSGTTTISTGSVILGSGTGTTGTGAVTVHSGGTILGSGVVQGSSFTAESGSTVQAGDSTAPSSYATLHFTPVSGSGAFDFQSGSSVILGINPGGTSDLLNFTGTGTSTLLFNGDLTIGPASFTPTATEVFNLLDWSGLASAPTFASRYTSAGLLTGKEDEAAGLDLPDISGSGFFWDISQFTVDGTIALVVPEPSRALLLLVGLFGLLARRRR